MALTYDQSAELMKNEPFKGRIKVAMLTYSTYILNEAPNVPGHSSRYRWAQDAAKQPEMTAIGLQPMVVMDGAVQGAGIDQPTGDSTISDSALQSSVETVVNKFV